MDYKNYSLQQLEDWIHDALQEASPQEVYATIRKVVQEQHNYHKERAQKCFDFLELLNGHRLVNFDDQVKKWVLPVQVDEDDVYYIHLPNDLLEAANLKAGDQVDWVNQGDGSYLLKKVQKEMTYDEAIAAGWTMTADGFWIKE